MPAGKGLSSTDMSCADGHRWWSTLSPELLVSILQRLPFVHDRIRFGSVCSLWRLVLMEARHLLPPTAPLLMLPYTEEDDMYLRQVHGIPSNWVHRILLPDSQNMSDQTLSRSEQEEYYRCLHRRKKVICGSSKGWLLVTDCCRDVHLWNPITRAEIPLPPPPCNFFCPRDKSCVDKFVLSASNPCSSGQLQDCCTVMVIRKCRCNTVLSFCRIRDDSWTTIASLGVNDNICYHDVNCYRGQFYAVTVRGEVVILDVGGPNPKMAVAADSDSLNPMDHVDDRTGDYSFQNYLVESSGELLRVARLIKWWAFNDEGPTHPTIKFVVHKLDFDTKTWSKVVSLGDQALFLGSSSSVSFAATDGYKRNSIYFLDDSYDPCLLGDCLESDMGVFDLNDGSVTTFVINKYTCSSNKNCSSLLYYPHFWIDLAPW